MGRLIDANALEERFSLSCGGECAVCSYNNTLCDIITEAPTVDAIPRERIEQMIAEILMKDFDRVTCGEDTLTPLDCVAIIRKYTKEQNNDRKDN